MGCASDDEYDLELEQEVEDESSPENPPLNARTIASTQTDVFDMVGGQHAITPAILLSFANGCCEELRISDGLKEDVLRTAKLPPQLLLIRLYARTVAFGKSIAGLLDVHISNYVEGTTPRFVKHIIENPSSYEIPTAVQAQFMHSKTFSSAVGKVLSTFRGELQRKASAFYQSIFYSIATPFVLKIQRSITDMEDIVTLASRLAIHGFQMTQEHLLRIAFLRTYYVEFTSKPNKADPPSKIKEKEKDKAETRFWSFIDTKIEKFNKKSPKERLSALERNLAKDKRAYPPPKGGAPAIPSAKMPEWQASASRVVSTMEGYQADTPAVGAQPVQAVAAQTDNANGGRNGPRHHPINLPNVEEEEEEEEEDRGPGIMPPQHLLPHLVTGGVGEMDIDSHYGNGPVPYKEHPPPASTPTHTTTVQTRRGAGQALVRGDSIRHNPIGLPNHPSAASSTPPPSQTSSRILRPRVATGSASHNPPGTHNHTENTQYDPRYSATVSGTLGYT
ncbi:hypothetical protein OPQ81_002409 [Rhizoctonia solani]|nr:hypothetical protein OPQ81_002409 [Rhizoctonia solani]